MAVFVLELAFLANSIKPPLHYMVMISHVKSGLRSHIVVSHVADQEEVGSRLFSRIRIPKSGSDSDPSLQSSETLCFMNKLCTYFSKIRGCASDTRLQRSSSGYDPGFPHTVVSLSSGRKNGCTDIYETKSQDVRSRNTTIVRNISTKRLHRSVLFLKFDPQ
jgi:hypothetical protein